jgi:prepilin-type N-terminal cleavage/methylation domain-containing protein
MSRVHRNRAGFTLIEIMIVVLIIAILLGIAMPNFLKSRESSRAKTCQANLRQICTSKEQWAMENRKEGSDKPTHAELVTEYMRARYEDVLPSCPSGGVYDVGDMVTAPECSTGANGPEAYDDHVNP